MLLEYYHLSRKSCIVYRRCKPPNLTPTRTRPAVENFDSSRGGAGRGGATRRFFDLFDTTVKLKPRCYTIAYSLPSRFLLRVVYEEKRQGETADARLQKISYEFKRLQ
jgi:hypothetical protein